MSERLETRAEVLKLARLLGVPQADLARLEDLPAADLRAFREQATARLFDAGASALRRVGVAAKMLPSGIVATIAQRAFGPLLCARAAGSVDTGKAIDVAGRLPPEFLADVAVELDPRRVAAIIAAVPEGLVVSVARELGRREEHVTMGRFLAFVPDHAIAAAMGVLSDATMLRTAFVLEHKDRLDHAIGLLPPQRLPGILRDASVLGLWPEALDLLDHLSDTRRGPIADVVAEQDETVIAALVAAVAQAGIWDSLLPVVTTMSADSRVRLAGMSPFHDPEILRDIITTAADQGLWVDLVPLIDALPGEVRLRVAEIAADLGAERLGHVLRDAAAEPHTLPTLLGLVAEMDDADRAEVIAAIDDADRSVGEQLVVALTDRDEIAALLRAVSAEVIAAITRAAQRLGLEQPLREALASAERTSSPLTRTARDR